MTLNKQTQQEKAARFRALHSGETLLVLPNIWDPLGAALLEDIGYPAIATASAAISYTKGVADAEQLEFGSLISLLKEIARKVDIPVSADIESGYAQTDEELAENIKQVLEAGVVGINIEDYDLKTRALFSIDRQSRRLAIVRLAAESLGIPLFINARTDVYAKPDPQRSDEEKWKEAVDRGKAYLAAGADSIYPIMLTKEEYIRRLVEALACPVNIVAIPGIPDMKRLKAIGVARLSLGPGFLKVALRAMKQIALQLKSGEGLAQVTDNEIGSDYLKKLIGRNAGA